MHPIQQPFYRTRAEIEELVQAFEQCTLSPKQFNHHAHMTVALWYLDNRPFAEATEQMRHNIRRFAATHHQEHLYNETITLFWLKLLRHFLDVADPTMPLPDVTHQALVSLGSMRFLFSHYSRERAFSEQARQQWLEPDLLPLPFGETLQ